MWRREPKGSPEGAAEEGADRGRPGGSTSAGPAERHFLPRIQAFQRLAAQFRASRLGARRERRKPSKGGQ